MDRLFSPLTCFATELRRYIYCDGFITNLDPCSFNSLDMIYLYNNTCICIYNIRISIVGYIFMDIIYIVVLSCVLLIHSCYSDKRHESIIEVTLRKNSERTSNIHFTVLTMVIIRVISYVFFFITNYLYSTVSLKMDNLSLISVGSL